MKDEPSPPQNEERKTDADKVAETPAAQEPAKEGLHWTKPSPAIQEGTKPSSHTGRWILILLATLIVGFGAAFFTLTLPAQQELKQVKADLTAAQEKLETTEAELESTGADLKTTTSELTGAQYSLALARVQANVAYARASLVSRDLLTTRQEVSAAATNLQELLPFIKDKNISTALEDRMKVIDKAVYTDSAKALEELRILSENLLRLEEQP